MRAAAPALSRLRLPAPALFVAGLFAFMAALLGALVANAPVLGLLLFAGLAGLLAMLAWPDLATLVIVFLLYTNIPAVAVRFHGAPYAIGVLIPLLLTIPVIHHLARGRGLVLTPVLGALTLFGLAQLVSTVLSRESVLAGDNLQTFAIEGLLIYLLITNAVRTPEALRLVFWALLVGGACLVALSAYQEATGNYSRFFGGFAQVGVEYLVFKEGNPRLAGPLGDSNYYAQILLALVPLGILRVWGERTRILRMAAAALTAFITYGVMLTFSRGAGVAFVLLLILAAFMRYVRPHHILAVVLVVLVVLNTVPAYKERVETLSSVGGATAEAGSEEATDVSLRSRVTEMGAAALVFVDHPFVGVGPGAFPAYYQEYAGKIGLEVRETVLFGARRGEESRRESHNMLLSIAAELGTFGLVTFGAVVFLTFRQLARARRRCLATNPEVANLTTALMLAIFAYLTTGLFLTLAFERYFWLLLALAGAATAIARRTQEETGTRVRTASGRLRPQRG